MKILIRPHSRDFLLPAWPFVGLSLAFLAIVGFAVRLLPARFSLPCGFHLAFGHPCPSCGVTRMGFALMAGHPLDALRIQPFFFFLIAFLGIWFVAGAALRLCRRDLRLELSHFETRWGWLVLLAAFLMNWAYLWRVGV